MDAPAWRPLGGSGDRVARRDRRQANAKRVGSGSAGCAPGPHRSRGLLMTEPCDHPRWCRMVAVDYWLVCGYCGAPLERLVAPWDVKPKRTPDAAAARHTRPLAVHDGRRSPARSLTQSTTTGESNDGSVETGVAARRASRILIGAMIAPLSVWKPATAAAPVASFDWTMPDRFGPDPSEGRRGDPRRPVRGPRVARAPVRTRPLAPVD